MESRSKVLITGATGFTGVHLTTLLVANGYECIPLQSDLLDINSLRREVERVVPDYVLHFAAVSFTQEVDPLKLYGVNVKGTENLLTALSLLKGTPRKVIIASSAAVYGDQFGQLSEKDVPRPTSHYGCSKLSMEFIARNFSDQLPVLITRPFNYTGDGHADHFVVPKIIKAVRQVGRPLLLGNLDVYREFNDVRDIAKYYLNLLQSELQEGVVNLCTGKSISLRTVVRVIEDQSGYKLNIGTHPDFVRQNEITKLCGDPSLLLASTRYAPMYDLEDTIRWMLNKNP